MQFAFSCVLQVQTVDRGDLTGYVLPQESCQQASAILTGSEGEIEICAQHPGTLQVVLARVRLDRVRLHVRAAVGKDHRSECPATALPPIWRKAKSRDTAGHSAIPVHDRPGLQDRYARRPGAAASIRQRPPVHGRLFAWLSSGFPVKDSTAYPNGQGEVRAWGKPLKFTLHSWLVGGIRNDTDQLA